MALMLEYCGFINPTKYFLVSSAFKFANMLLHHGIERHYFGPSCIFKCIIS